MPGLSHTDCLWAKGPSGGGPEDKVQLTWYLTTEVSCGRGRRAKMVSWRNKVIATEVKKAGSASEATCLTSYHRPKWGNILDSVASPYRVLRRHRRPVFGAYLQSAQNAAARLITGHTATRSVLTVAASTTTRRLLGSHPGSLHGPALTHFIEDCRPVASHSFWRRLRSAEVDTTEFYF